MFRRFTLYIDIVTSHTLYPSLLNLIETYTHACEPITNVGDRIDPPKFLYDLLIVEADRIDFENGDLETIQHAYSKVIVLNMPRHPALYECLYAAGVTDFLSEGFFEIELEILMKNYMTLERLTQENTFLDNLLNSAQNSIVITDRKGNIQYANPYFESMSEYAADELIHQSPNIMLTGQHSREFYRTLWKTIMSGKVWEGIFINRSKKGETFYEEATITPVRNTHGTIEKFLKIGKNITRERMLLDELSKEIKVAQKVLRTFLPEPFEDDLVSFDYVIEHFNEIGGDFLLFRKSAPGTYHFAILDVMGHGASAAIIAIAVSQMMGDYLGYMSLAAIVRNINDMLCDINSDSNEYAKYVTGMFIEVNVRTRAFTCINAGHPNLFIEKRDGSTRSVIPNNMMLGVIRHEYFNTTKIAYDDIARIIAFTDGLYESQGQSLEQALERLKTLSGQRVSAEEILKNFGINDTPQDDATVATLSFTHPG